MGMFVFKEESKQSLPPIAKTTHLTMDIERKVEASLVEMLHSKVAELES
jgi:hypothetical protein